MSGGIQGRGRIPLVDLGAQYRSIKEEIDAAVQEVMERAAFVGGPYLKRFETEFAQYCSTPDCVGVGNGTDALALALEALGVGEGDEVVTVSHTFMATAEAILQVGATPVFVDILPETMLIDPARVRDAVTPRTKAIIPVHLYGQMADMDAIRDVARTHGLFVVEDAAQAHGARWNARRAGSLGDLACFSFYPGKNLGAYGDGGAVVGGDAALMDHVRMLSNHGRREKYVHEIPGRNSRLDALQAAVLSVKLRRLDLWNARRREIAERYLRRLAGMSGVQLPNVASPAESVWHLFVIRVRNRNAVRNLLQDHGIDAGVHYPVPLHLQPALEGRFETAGLLENTERAAGEVLSLPMYPEMDDDIVDTVVETLKRAV